MKPRSFLPEIAALILIIGLPLIGTLITRQPVSRFLEFPPQTHYVGHAGFSWPVFIVLAVLILAVIAPFLIRILFPRRAATITALDIQVGPSATVSEGRANPQGEPLFIGRLGKPCEALGRDACPALRRTSPYLSGLPLRSPDQRRFPAWGWIGIAVMAAAWILAWTRFQWFAPLQAFTFSPLWLGFIITVNALTWRRTGQCMLTHRTRYFLALFPASALFWWMFEYLNRFVQNWYYAGIGSLTPPEYFIFATLPFATVLPAVLGTCDLLASFPRLSMGLNKSGLQQMLIKEDRFGSIPQVGRTLWVSRSSSDGSAGPSASLRAGTPRPTCCTTRRVAAVVLVISAAGLAAIGLWPDYLFPLLWLSPLGILAALLTLNGRTTLFSAFAQGDQRRFVLLALAALICGFFWEMWNYFSLAKWIYAVPFVNRFHIFEMPLLGYAGYLPFGLECAIIADRVAEWCERSDNVVVQSEMCL